MRSRWSEPAYCWPLGRGRWATGISSILSEELRARLEVTDLKDRREFLKLCAASVPALALAKDVPAEQLKSGQPAPSAYRTPATLERYIDPLPIPKAMLP